MENYETLPTHKFFEVMSSLASHEIRPGNTMTFLSEVDLSEIEIIRQQWSGKRKPSYTTFVAKACSLALREFPYANRRLYRRFWLPLSKMRLQQFNSCTVAVAVERNVPNAESVTFVDQLKEVDKLSLNEITDWLYELATCDESNNEQWRQFNSLVNNSPHWFSKMIVRLPFLFPSMWAKYRGGPLLVSSPAKYGVDVISGSWTAPLGVSFGLVKDRPIVRNGQVVVAKTFTLTLNFDRRVMAGAQAAKFFKRIVDVLENALSEMAPYYTLDSTENTNEASPKDAPSKVAELAHASN